LSPLADRPVQDKELPFRRPWVVLALICLPIFIGALDLTIVSAVLPAVLNDLEIPAQTGLDDAAWVVSGYLLAYTISMTFMGRVSDLWGRKRVYMICLAIFIVGSALAAAAPQGPAQILYRINRTLTGSRPDLSFMSLHALILGRVVQAFGAGGLVPVSMALVGDIFPPDRRAAPLGVIGGVDTAGWVLGHLYGGLMVQRFAWPVLFWLNLPLAGGAMIVTAWALRAVPRARKSGRFDWGGAIVLAIVLTAFSLALNAGAEASPGLSLSQLQDQPPLSLPLLLGAGLGLVIFLQIERRILSPLIDLRIFRDRNVLVATLVNLLVGFCVMAGLVSVPLYMNTVPTVLYGIDEQQAALIAGYLLSGLTIPMAIASVVGGQLTNWLGYRWTTALGALLAVAGFWLMSLWTADQSQPVVMLFDAGFDMEYVAGTGRMASGLILAGIGLGFTISPIATTVINSVTDAERGVASALVIIMRLIGMTISISFLTTYGLRRSLTLRIVGLEGVAFTDLAKQAEVLVESTTQVIGEMALITAAVSVGALALALFLRNRGVQEE